MDGEQINSNDQSQPFLTGAESIILESLYPKYRTKAQNDYQRQESISNKSYVDAVKKGWAGDSSDYPFQTDPNVVPLVNGDVNVEDEDIIKGLKKLKKHKKAKKKAKAQQGEGAAEIIGQIAPMVVKPLMDLGINGIGKFIQWIKNRRERKRKEKDAKLLARAEAGLPAEDQGERPSHIDPKTGRPYPGKLAIGQGIRPPNVFGPHGGAKEYLKKRSDKYSQVDTELTKFRGKAFWKRLFAYCEAEITRYGVKELDLSPQVAKATTEKLLNWMIPKSFRAFVETSTKEQSGEGKTQVDYWGSIMRPLVTWGANKILEGSSVDKERILNAINSSIGYNKSENSFGQPPITIGYGAFRPERFWKSTKSVMGRSLMDIIPELAGKELNADQIAGIIKHLTKKFLVKDVSKEKIKPWVKLVDRGLKKVGMPPKDKELKLKGFGVSPPNVRGGMEWKPRRYLPNPMSGKFDEVRKKKDKVKGGSFHVKIL